MPKVYVRERNGKVLTLETEKADTVLQLKSRILEKVSLDDENRIKLVYKDSELDDKSTLQSNGIEENDFIDLIPKHPDEFSITAVIADERIKVEVPPHYSVESLKFEIAQKTYNADKNNYLLPPHLMILVFTSPEDEELILENDKPLEHYGLTEGDEVFVTTYIEFDNMFGVNVVMPNGKTERFIAHEEFTIQYFKYLIAQKLYLPENRIFLTHDSKGLDAAMNRETFQSAGIFANATINVTADEKFDNVFPVDVVMLNNKKQRFMAHDDFLIGYFKNVIATKLTLKLDDFILITNTTTLHENRKTNRKTIQDIGIVENDNIFVKVLLDGGFNHV